MHVPPRSADSFTPRGDVVRGWDVPADDHTTPVSGCRQTVAVTDDLSKLNRFVLRARRLEAHSLACDRESLASLSEFTLTGHLKLDGSMEMRRALPPEEAFESLATRVRPLLVKSESVFYERVLASIRGSLKSAPVTVPSEFWAQLEQLERQWSKFDLDGKDVLWFAMQAATLDGSETTPQVSDTQLAAAWLYGDLVHVDTRGNKSEGLLFPVKERYSAAVSYFSGAVLLALTTLDLVMALHELGVLSLDKSSLEADVVVGVDQLVENGVAYVAPVGSTMPALDMTTELPEEFRPFTVTELLRQTPDKRVDVVLTPSDGTVVAQYEAAVSRRGEKNGRLHWEALVAGAVSVEVSFGTGPDEDLDGRFHGMTSHASTNRMKLAEALLMRQLASSTQMTFRVADRDFFALTQPSPSEAEITSLDVALDTLYDLVVIENITHQELRPLTGLYKTKDRAILRRTRLLWEGHVVPFRSGPTRATAEAGVVPQVILMEATTHSVGETEIPLPRTYIRHPLMTPESVTAVAGSEPPQDQMDMVVPQQEPFLAWAPEKRQVTGDVDLGQPTMWDLSHFD